MTSAEDAHEATAAITATRRWALARCQIRMTSAETGVHAIDKGVDLFAIWAAIVADPG